MKNYTIIFFTCVVMAITASPLFANEPLRFVYYRDYAPFGWEEDGQMQGIYVDIVNEAFAKRLGISVTHEGHSWERAQRMVELGMADGYCTTITPERLVFSHASVEPIIEVDFKIYASSQSPNLEALRKVQQIGELKRFKLIDYSGSGWAKNNLLGMDIRWLQSNEQMFQFLVLGRGDAMVKNEVTTRYNLKKFGYQNRIVELPHPMTREPSSFHLFIGKLSPYVKYLTEFDQLIRQMREDGTLKRIYDKYR